MSTVEIARSIPQVRLPEKGDRGSGPRVVDTSTNDRIAVVMEMVGELSRATEPKQVLRAFADGMVRLNGPRGYVSLSTRGLRPGEYKITRFRAADSIRNIDAEDPWKNWNNLPTHTGGLFGRIIRKAYPELIHHLYLKDDPVLGDSLSRYGSMMAIPLFENGEPLNWAIQLQEDPEGFTEQELEESILRSNLGGATVRNVMVTSQLREANARIRAEIEQVARIQRALLPASLPQIPGLRIATSFETFDTAGGDLYDFITLNRQDSGPSRFDGWLAMLIADASGHGPAAAVIAAMLHTLLYAYPRDGRGPGAVLEYANRHLFAKRMEGTFVTAFLALFDPLTRTLIYARAGHNPPLLKNPGSGGSVMRLESVGGIPLGILDDVPFENGTLQLHSGQTLVLYTDGITEAADPAGDMFGVEGIERALEACSGEPECVINSITTALKTHEAGVRPRDDQTIVAIKVD